MKIIILPTDFSKNAQKAIDYAVRLLENEECIFFLLHAYHEAPSSEITKMIAQEELNELVKKMESQNEGKKHHFNGVLETDSVLNLINQTQENEGADYIFIGTKGSSTLREIFIGSNTLDLINYVEGCPIVMVPEGYQYNSLKEIVFATNFKNAFISLELKPLIDMASLWNSTLNIAYVRTEEDFSDTQKSNKELLRTELKGIKHKFIEVEQRDSVANTLYQIEKSSNNFGMISILKTKHGFFQKLTRENVIKNISFQTELPLLVLPQRK